MDYPSGTNLVINSNAVFCYRNLPPSLFTPFIDSKIKRQMTPRTFQLTQFSPNQRAASRLLSEPWPAIATHWGFSSPTATVLNKLGPVESMWAHHSQRGGWCEREGRGTLRGQKPVMKSHTEQVRWQAAALTVYRYWFGVVPMGSGTNARSG